MKCPACVEDGERSTLYDAGGVVTNMGWSSEYDENGVYHSHDPNWHSQSYRCSRGHSIHVDHLSRCANCDYGKDSATWQVVRLGKSRNVSVQPSSSFSEPKEGE